MRRREFITLLGGAAMASPVIALAEQSQRDGEAQSGAKVWRIGFVEAGSVSVNRHFLDAFRQGMSELGYVEGRQLLIEERWADGRRELFSSLLAEIIQLKVDIIVVSSSSGALAARHATATIPIVFVGPADPVGEGLVASLARPGRNMTGVSLAWDAQFYGKWVELLREVVPEVSRLGLLWSGGVSTGGATVLKELEDLARTQAVEIESFPVRALDEFDGALAAMKQKRIGGLIVLPGPLTLRHRARVLDLTGQERIPAIYGFGEFARAGGLLAYGANPSEMFRRAATYVVKIFKGASAGELPVEQPTKFEFVINLRAAKLLGLTLPPSLLARADEVIE